MKREASFGLLVADLCVLTVALDTALDAEYPTWFRTASAAVLALAVVLAIHSVVALRRQRRIR